MTPCNENNVKIAHPLFEENIATGWYKFGDDYLSPEIIYGNFPPVTTIKIGGRYVEIDRPVSVKLRLLEEHEDRRFWCDLKQHQERVNIGEFHRDFGDVEVAYSFSSPQTHIWFAGYSIHADCFENISCTSHNATVRVRPEHVLPPNMPAMLADFIPVQQTVIAKEHRMEIDKSIVQKATRDEEEDRPIVKPLYDIHDPYRGRSIYEMVVEDGAEYPLYSTMVPRLVEGLRGYNNQYDHTPEHLNNCERQIWHREQMDIGAGISQASHPVSVPPVYPPIFPYENPGLVWSAGKRGPLKAIREQIAALEDLAEKLQGRGGKLSLAKPHGKIPSKPRSWEPPAPPPIAGVEDMLDKRIDRLRTKRERHRQKEQRRKEALELKPPFDAKQLKKSMDDCYQRLTHPKGLSRQPAALCSACSEPLSSCICPGLSRLVDVRNPARRSMTPNQYHEEQSASLMRVPSSIANSLSRTNDLRLPSGDLKIKADAPSLTTSMEPSPLAGPNKGRSSHTLPSPIRTPASRVTIPSPPGIKIHPEASPHSIAVPVPVAHAGGTSLRPAGVPMRTPSVGGRSAGNGIFYGNLYG